jgi:hypothetical protein
VEEDFRRRSVAPWGIATLALALSLYGEATSAEPPCPEILQVGAWNIEWLGRPAQRKSRIEQRAADVARYVGASGVDVLALEEISVTHRGADGAARNRTLDAAFAVLDADGASWAYRLFDKRAGARDPDDQWTGLAWNQRRVRAVGEPWKLPIEIDARREAKLRAALDGAGSGPLVLQRFPHALKLSAGERRSDFVLVPLHLKSNRGGEAATAAVRGYEIELVLAGLATTPAPRDADVVLLGDTNVLTPGEPALAALRTAGFLDCNVRELKTFVGRPGAPFDRIFLVAAQPETARSCPARGNGSQPLDFRLVRPTAWKPGATTREFVAQLSDHLLVRAGLCVRGDDD